ncbi:MAG: hypothetical protein GY937_24895 [bacterium]|nr:hypothetical protein [bacterium]
MKLSMFCILLFALALPVACGRDEAKKMADEAAASAGQAMDAAKDAAGGAADAVEGAAADAADAVEGAASDAADAADEIAQDAKDAVAGTAAAVGDEAVAACRSLAEAGNWGEALDVCTKAHELLPDDLGIEHALQQAKAAAAE